MFLVLNKFSKVFVSACLAQVFLCGTDLNELQNGVIATKGSVHVHTPYNFDCGFPLSARLPPLPTGLPSLGEIHENWRRLTKCDIGDNAHKQGIIADYKACVAKINAFQNFERYWTEHQMAQLTCYEISILLGCANVYGSARDNKNQFDYAKRAYDLLKQLNRDVDKAYVDGSSMYLRPTTQTAIRIMERAEAYLLRDCQSKS